MELTDFIEGIRTAPRKKKKGQEYPLTRDYGIVDNWAILLKTDAETLETYLESRGFVALYESPESMVLTPYKWLRVNMISPVSTQISSDFGIIPPLRKDGEFQRQNFTRGLLFYKTGLHDGVKWDQVLEEMVNRTIDLKEWAIQNGISFCLPFAGPPKDPKSENVVYHLATAQEKDLYRTIMAGNNPATAQEQKLYREILAGKK